MKKSAEWEIYGDMVTTINELNKSKCYFMMEFYRHLNILYIDNKNVITA